jgi:hypothetical protein
MSDEPVTVEAVRKPFKTSPCRGCGKPIVWALKEDGGKIPLDPRPGVYRVAVDHAFGDGELRAVLKPDCLVTHFATCPKANWFSGSGKSS